MYIILLWLKPFGVRVDALSILCQSGGFACHIYIYIYIYIRKAFKGVRVKQHQYHILKIIYKYILKSLIFSLVSYVK